MIDRELYAAFLQLSPRLRNKAYRFLPSVEQPAAVEPLLAESVEEGDLTQSLTYAGVLGRALTVEECDTILEVSKKKWSGDAKKWSGDANEHKGFIFYDNAIEVLNLIVDEKQRKERMELLFKYLLQNGHPACINIASVLGIVISKDDLMTVYDYHQQRDQITELQRFVLFGGEVGILVDIALEKGHPDVAFTLVTKRHSDAEMVKNELEKITTACIATGNLGLAIETTDKIGRQLTTEELSSIVINAKDKKTAENAADMLLKLLNDEQAARDSDLQKV